MISSELPWGGRKLETRSVTSFERAALRTRSISELLLQGVGLKRWQRQGPNPGVSEFVKASAPPPGRQQSRAQTSSSTEVLCDRGRHPHPL